MFMSDIWVVTFFIFKGEKEDKEIGEEEVDNDELYKEVQDFICYIFVIKIFTKSFLTRVLQFNSITFKSHGHLFSRV